MSENPIAIAWIVGNDTGSSSKAIWAKMMGQAGEKEHPWDAFDLGRCLRLLALIPLWELRVKEMSDVSPYWAALVERWHDLKATYLEESDGSYIMPSGKGAKTRDLIKSIIRPIEKKDSSFVRLSDTVSIRISK